MASFTSLTIPDTLLARVIEHAREAVPNECCGLLGGGIADCVALASVCLPIANDLADPRCYLTNARDLFDAFRSLRADNLELLAVYHSHPQSSPVPSRRDVEENTYGETAIHLIVGLAGSEPEVRAWWLTESAFCEAEWKVSRVPKRPHE
jgi:proteasome lid subunit RPN8/RPN11